MSPRIDNSSSAQFIDMTSAQSITGQKTFVSGLIVGLGNSVGPTYGQTKLVAGSGIGVSTAVGINSTIMLSVGNAGIFNGLGSPYVGNKAPGSSFQIRSTNAADTSVIYWWILN